MTNRNTEQQPQGESGSPSVAAAPPSGQHLRPNSSNTVFKSGPLFLSSKGIGWTSWKKRWFILTRTSLVFFRSDPNAVPQKGSEVNLTLGGIDLNNSGRVDFKVDKKLLTVLFPDGRDGRAFTLKAETLEDLFEWKDALENALAQAPSPSNAMGQNETEIQPITSKVIGRPVLLALEEVDGTPSFLEKALQFIEEHGVKVEGILRQAAYVQDVERRIREYEKGKTEFSAEEDAHVIADCVKYIIRELPSSPVPASCCKALLEAIRTDRAVRVNNVRAAICDTFPEPNRRLLQRILTMMQKIVSNKAENRMSCSAVAACMAPLLLRPLLAGDCEIENDFDVGGDNSLQLLQAAAAANHAQVIVITLLDEYDKFFGEGSMTPDFYSDEDESGSETEEETEDDVSYEDDESDNLTQDSDAETDDEIDIVSSGTCSEDYDTGDKHGLQHDKEKDGCSIGSNSREADDNHEVQHSVSSKSLETSVSQPNTESNKNEWTQNNKNVVMASNESAGVAKNSSQQTSLAHKCPPSCMQKSTSVSNRPRQSVKSKWGRTSARKNLSMESVDFSLEEEADIQGLEATKTELENKIAEEAKKNAVLHENLERQKKTMHRRRLALEQDVERLQEQLQIERDIRVALEAGLKMSKGPIPNLTTVDKKTKAELEEVAAVEADIANLKQKVDDLGMQLNQQREQTQDRREKLKDKCNDNETLARSHREGSRSKNANLSREENENEKKSEMSSAVSKHTPQPAVAKASTSKKSAAKEEGTNFTSSTLSKLTNRLNFLKERRSQITNDLLNMEKNQGSSHEQDCGQLYDRGVQTEEQGSRNSEKVKKLESQSLNHAERAKTSEAQIFHSMDRGKSESNVSIDIEKGRVVEGQPSVSQKKSTS